MEMRRDFCIVPGFAAMSTLTLVLTLFVLETAHSDETTNIREHRQTDFNPGVSGVSSVAGITSRNGRVSTTGGIHFYPAPGGTLGNDNEPYTFTKAINGKYATGSVRIHPGALSVSSSAGFVDPNFSWPVQTYKFPSQENWFSENHWPFLENQWVSDQWLRNINTGQMPWYKIKFDPQSSNVRNWIYPSFKPFLNIWR